MGTTSPVAVAPWLRSAPPWQAQGDRAKAEMSQNRSADQMSAAEEEALGK